MKLKKYKYIDEETEIVHDPEYLEILMEIQENIESAITKEELTIIKTKIILKIDDIKNRISETFGNNRLEDVYENLRLMKFYLSLLNQAETRVF